MTTATHRTRLPGPGDAPGPGRVSADAVQPGLRLSGLAKTLGGRLVVDELDLDVADGELVCLLGPSGCGKTTTLRMIGGFLRPDSGEVLIAGQPVTELAPDRRPTAMVFQNYALWPHMTVRANVAFGLKVHRVPRDEIEHRVSQVLELVNLTRHRDSYPARISGGEQQRAALARALVLRPQVLLLDEPLSNLDAKLRVRVREDIRTIQQELGITTVLVTHDQDEALTVADRIAVMNDGRIEQLSTPRELYRRPRTRFVAEFVGTMNLFPGAVTDDGAELAGSRVAVREPSRPVSGALVGIRPEDVLLSRPGADDGPLGRVVREIPRGGLTEVVVELGPNRLRALVSADVDPLRAWPGGEVSVAFTRVLAYVDGLLVEDGPSE